MRVDEPRHRVGARRGLRGIVLETQTNNLPACRFYQAMGFKLCGIDDHFYSNDDIGVKEVAIFWWYELDSPSPVEYSRREKVDSTLTDKPSRRCCEHTARKTHSPRITRCITASYAPTSSSIVTSATLRMALSLCAAQASTCSSRWWSCARINSRRGRLAAPQGIVARSALSRCRAAISCAHYRSEHECAGGGNSLVFEVRRSSFTPIINVLVMSSRGPDGTTRFIIRAADGTVVAESGTNWRSDEFAEVFVQVEFAARGRGLGKSVASACTAYLLEYNLRPLYIVDQNNSESVAIAQALGYTNTGVREHAYVGSLTCCMMQEASCRRFLLSASCILRHSLRGSHA